MKILNAIAVTALCCLCINVYAEEFDAVIDYSPRVELSLPVSGIVDKVTVSAGQQVKKGEIMISLDQAPFKADRELMQSHVTFQQARLTESTRDLKHQQELYDRTVLSSVELENAELRVKRDSALLASARARFARADYDFSVSQLRAPFDASVMTVSVNEGQAINNAFQSKTLISLVRQGYYVARFNAAAGQLEKLKIGMPVKVVTSDARYPAKISAVVYQRVNKDTGINNEATYSVEAGFLTEGDSMPVGKKASVVIE